MKRREIAPLIAIAVILLGLSIGSAIAPDAVFSANENRYLQQAPQLSWRTLMNGEFTADAEDYTADQILLRDAWMGSKSTIQQLTGKKDIGGVWLGADGYYFAKLSEEQFNRASYEKNLAAVESFFAANDEKPCHILLAPTPASVLYEYLPYGEVGYRKLCYDDAACYQALTERFGEQAILTQNALRAASAEEQTYYRTDHHWTSAGAYTAYKAWAESTGHTVREYRMETVTDSFRGTLYSKVLLPNSAYDEVAIAPDVSIAYMDCDGERMNSLYVMSALESKDKYEVFLGGNYAKATVETGAGTGRSLLLIKDSFANCFLPFLAADYDTITVLDLRYCRENVQELANGCTDVLVLYEMSNFAADSNLYKLNLA